MSTDNYLDFIDLASKEEADGDGFNVSSRIGHVAVTHHWRHDLLGALNTLVLAAPTVESWVPLAARRVCEAHFAEMQRFVATVEPDRMKYEYGDGGPCAGEVDADMIEPADLEALLQEHIGHRWRTRVD